ncbi:MAG: anthranilate synthase component I family protein [Bacteroidota bacterium]
MKHPFVCVLDNCEHEIDRYGKYEWLAGFSSKRNFNYRNWSQIQALKGSWLMGILPYELKDQIQKHTHTSQPSFIQFPSLPLFQPELVLAIPRGSHQVMVLEGAESPLKHELEGWLKEAKAKEAPQKKIWNFQPNFSRRRYIETIEQLREHIRQGDSYEINLAQAFHAEGKLDRPDYWYHRLIELSPVPFAAFVKYEEQYLLCASPERFLQLDGQTLRTQPIKGTAPRSSNKEEDEAHFQYLSGSKKEQAENVMIVDLSRNDLYRSSIPHTVEVPHLFEIQAFPQVYQMVSTVEGQKQEGLDWTDIMSNTFPPGSMTGAPKLRTMQLIDQYEPESRGVYAGSVGYIEPGGNFDWNVIIRSLVYDDARERLSYHVGGAITYDSDPVKEYEETLLKATALRRIFG